MFEILDICVALPKHLQSMEAASKELFISAKNRRMYERYFGLETFPRDANQTLISMTDQACSQLAESTGFTKNDLDLVVFCHTLPSIGPIRTDMVLPIEFLSTDSNEAFSVTMNHCATAVSVLEMIDLLLPADGTALILVGDKGFHPVLREIKNTTIMGESAVAMLAVRAPGKFRYIATYTGRRCKYAIMSGLVGAKEEDGFSAEYCDFVASCIETLLQRCNLTMKQIKLILPHNVNLPSWVQISGLAGASSDQVYLKNVPRLGHMFNSDPFLNLMDATEEGRLQRGDYVLLVSVGMGATASCAIFEVSGIEQQQKNARTVKGTANG